MTPVLREDAGGISTLTLNRPEKLNAISPDTLRALQAHFHDLAASDIRCVILRGNGRSFCAGADLDVIKTTTERPATSLGSETIRQMEELPMPVIAVIHGHCYTGGLELVMGADMIVAAENTVIRDTHAAWGAVPGWGLTARLPRRIAPAFAREIIFTCRPVSAAEALRMGLVNRVVPLDQLGAAAREMAGQVAGNVPPAIRADKKIMREAVDMTLPQAIAHEATNLPPRREVREHLKSYWPGKAAAGTEKA